MKQRDDTNKRSRPRRTRKENHVTLNLYIEYSNALLARVSFRRHHMMSVIHRGRSSVT